MTKSLNGHRIMIILAKGQYEKLVVKATKQGCSVAWLVRQAIDQTLTKKGAS